MGIKLPRGPAIRALLWEDWRRNQVVFFASVALGFALVVSIRVLAGSDWGALRPHEVTPILRSTCILPLLLFGMVTLFSHGDMRDLSTGIPLRHWTLPVAPAVAATLHLGFRLTALCIVAVLHLAFGQILLDAARLDDYILVLLWAVPIFLLAQSLAWTIGYFGTTPFLVSLAIVPLALIGAAEPLSILFAALTVDHSAAFNVVVWLAFLGALAGISIAGAIRGRHFRPDFSPATTVVTPRREHFSLRKTRALDEHTWYEWVQRGYLLPILTATFTGFATVGVGILVMLDHSANNGLMMAGVLGYAAIFLSPGTAALAGLRMMLDDRRTAQSGLGAYLYSHPLSTCGFAHARLRMALRSVLANQAFCLICLLLGTPMIVAFSGSSSFATIFTLDHIVRFFLLGIGHTLLVWTMFWMGIPAILFWFWYLAVVSTYDLLGLRDEGMLIPIVVAPAAILLAGLTLYVGIRTRLLRLLDVRLIFRSGVVAVMALPIVLWYFSSHDLADLVSFETLLHQPIIVIGIVALSLCPAIPILAQPLLVHRLRHR